MEGHLVLSCSICNDSCDSGDNTNKKVGILRCGHVFHKNCVYAWWEELGRASSLRNCPICQTVFYYDSMMNAYPTLQSSDSCAENARELDRQLAEINKKEELLTQLQAVNGKLKEEMNEIKATSEATAKELNLELQINQNLKLENEFLKQASTIAYSNCDSLQMQVQNLQRTSDQLKETLDARTKYFISRLHQVTRLNSFTSGLQTQVINEESEPSAQNFPVDLSIFRPGFNSRARADGTANCANADNAENIDPRFEHLQMTQSAGQRRPMRTQSFYHKRTNTNK